MILDAYRVREMYMFREGDLETYREVLKTKWVEYDMNMVLNMYILVLMFYME